MELNPRRRITWNRGWQLPTAPPIAECALAGAFNLSETLAYVYFEGEPLFEDGSGCQ
jgi:hypothetical protein